MNSNVEVESLSSAEKVREFANVIICIADAVHHSLRRLSSEIVANCPLTSYALLTEEYALRSRAHILINDAKRFVIVEFKIPHDELIDTLNKIEDQMKTVENFDLLYDLLIALMLFANSIVSKNKRVISFMYDELNLINKS